MVSFPNLGLHVAQINLVELQVNHPSYELIYDTTRQLIVFYTQLSIHAWTKWMAI